MMMVIMMIIIVMILELLLLCHSTDLYQCAMLFPLSIRACFENGVAMHIAGSVLRRVDIRVAGAVLRGALGAQAPPKVAQAPPPPKKKN